MDNPFERYGGMQYGVEGLRFRGWDYLESELLGVLIDVAFITS